ncbi:MAG: hypothetical protein DRH21_05455, partial [Deltaproteobacteria bacterium]
MIAMMYLVLTALLALNVSKEILDAFLVVNKSMESTHASTAAKSRQMYTTFENQYTMNQEKVGPFWKEAQNVRSKSDEMVDYLENQKLELVKVADRKDEDEVYDLYYQDTVIHGIKKKVLILRDVPTKDKFDATTTYMVRPGNKGEAYVLSGKMQEYR